MKAIKVWAVRCSDGYLRDGIALSTKAGALERAKHLDLLGCADDCKHSVVKLVPESSRVAGRGK